jgi:hypothetical protein
MSAGAAMRGRIRSRHPTVVTTFPFTETSTTVGTRNDVNLSANRPGGTAPDYW